MPKGLPTASELMEQRAVTFFSIDTDVIQSLGYKFNVGALSALRLQRPGWLSIRLTEVVQREIMAHRMEPVEQSVQELRSALAKAQRLAGYDMTDVQKCIHEMPLAKIASERFTDEFDGFLHQLGGSVLPLDGPELAQQMFARYFAERAPFESRKEKKAEFPDAAALLVLEGHARDQKTRGILISKDGGWSNFANESDVLYCVKSLEEFVALFESTGDNADSVKSKVKASLIDPSSELSLQLEEQLSRHVEGVFWRVDDVYSGYNLRVEADVHGVGFDGSAIDPDDLRLWFVEYDPTVCTVELTISIKANLDIGIDFYQYDSVDRDEVNVASDEINKPVQIDVEVFLTCRGDLLGDTVDEWDVDIGISGGDYRVDVGEVNPEPGDDY